MFIFCLMVKLMAMNLLSGQIELDQGYFSTTVLFENKGKLLKRGWESQKKTKVLVMTESKEDKGYKNKKGKQRKVGFIKM